MTLETGGGQVPDRIIMYVTIVPGSPRDSPEPHCARHCTDTGPEVNPYCKSLTMAVEDERQMGTDRPMWQQK